MIFLCTKSFVLGYSFAIGVLGSGTRLSFSIYLFEGFIQRGNLDAVD